MKKVVPKLRQEVKVKVDIVTSDDIKIYNTWKFKDFTATCRYICNKVVLLRPVYLSKLCLEFFFFFSTTQGPYLTTVLKNVLSLVLQIFLYLEAIESNTS